MRERLSFFIVAMRAEEIGSFTCWVNKKTNKWFYLLGQWCRAVACQILPACCCHRQSAPLPNKKEEDKRNEDATSRTFSLIVVMNETRRDKSRNSEQSFIYICVCLGGGVGTTHQDGEPRPG